MSEHIPFQYDTCKCDGCIRIREKKITDKLKEEMTNTMNERMYGSNWKNILSGMGDQ